MREEATITSKGQVTIPKVVRHQLGLKRGEKIIFVDRAGEIVIKPKIKDPVSKLREMRKVIKIRKKEIDRMIAESKKDWSKFQ